MDIRYDPAKNAKNIAERGLSFEQVAEFEFATAVYTIDDRRDYGERRYRMVGYLNGRLHVLVALVMQDGIRVISFRKANNREARYYAQKIKL